MKNPNRKTTHVLMDKAANLLQISDKKKTLIKTIEKQLNIKFQKKRTIVEKAEWKKIALELKGKMERVRGRERVTGNSKAMSFATN